VISEPAKHAIDYIFDKSVKKNLVLDPDDVCNIERLTGSDDGDFLFKVLTIFHLGEDSETRDYFLQKTTDKTFSEVFSEIGNLCSGAMNHELLKYFPHLGMSTPYVLSSKCLPFLSELKAGYMSRHTISINGSVRLQATVCMYGYAPIDFTVDKTDVVDMTGELEMF
jgi:hypothetical protein